MTACRPPKEYDVTQFLPSLSKKQKKTWNQFPSGPFVAKNAHQQFTST